MKRTLLWICALFLACLSVGGVVNALTKGVDWLDLALTVLLGIAALRIARNLRGEQPAERAEDRPWRR
ncbi:hypothetical protein GCM10010193_69980 [Kitasatospora atroaurantiaca]|uniref:Uncharacterized protein n=1 Tax=Kitasatospora atroaurantiaca TaxID=285545 RepID=A0A561ENA2_9ACTN|nr:hypothetical protein [Kitasatospora atroaurantiaca]TWE17084.1 hypothetical protein FB465_2089 [Kitasatospora atroaurantiaca]